MSTWYEMDDNGYVRMMPSGQYPKMGNRRVAESTVGERWISTVFLGLDHAWPGGRPLLFETMVFPHQNDLSDELCWRYSTKAEAEAGHAYLVAQIEAGTPLDDIEQP